MTSCLKPTNELPNSSGMLGITSGDWVLDQDFWNIATDELLFPSDEIEWPSPAVTTSIKRARPTGGAFSNVLAGKKDQPLVVSSSDTLAILDKAHKSEHSMKDVKTFSIPSFSSFPAATFTAVFRSNSKPSSGSDPALGGSGRDGSTDWNRLFYDLMHDAPAEPETPTSTADAAATTTKFSEIGNRVPAVPPEKVTETKKSNNKKSPAKSSKPRQTQECVLEPNESDVLLGRGGRSNHHKGNIVYRQLVEENKIGYKDRTKGEKTRISRCLVKRIQTEHKGRFLDLVDGKWYVVEDAVARKKVSQALRENSTAEFRKAKREKYAPKK